MSRNFVLDANVLFSARLRDLWLQLAIHHVACIVMSDAIELEWTAALTRRRPELRSNIARTAQMIRSRMPEVYLTLDELSPLTIALPDPNDLHVVQAAVATDGTIVTFNVHDFPAPTMASLGIKVLTPDAAFLSLASTDEEGMLTAATQIRTRLREPPISPESYAAGFASAGCPEFSAWLMIRAARL